MGTNTKTFKIDDIVKYTSGKHLEGDDNPLWGGKYGKVTGTITDIYDGTISVRWNNSTHNTYDSRDLELVSFDWNEEENR